MGLSMQNNTLVTLESHPELRTKVLGIIEKAFNYSEGHSFQSDFYPLFCEDNSENCHVLLKEGIPIGHIGVLKKSIRVADRDHPVLLIGGIAMTEECRGKGFFSDFFNCVLSLYKDDVALFFLWGNFTDLYLKFHFYEVGEIFQWGEKPFGSSDSPSVFKKVLLSECDFEQLERIRQKYYKEALILNRSKEDWEKLSCISGMQIYTYGTPVNSYFFANKGMDLQGVIHEIAGDYPFEQDSFFINRKTWASVSSKHSKETILFSSFVRIGDEQSFRNFIESISSGKIKITSISEKFVAFTFGGQEFSLEPELLLTGLFGPGPFSEFQSFIRPLAIMGPDSI
jgi:hypothetical protein